MLLLLISVILLKHGVLYCDDEDEELRDKSDYLDYSVTGFWWNGTPGINATELMTPPASFLPTPEGHGQFPDVKRFTVPTSPNDSRPYQHPGLSPPPNFPSDYWMDFTTHSSLVSTTPPTIPPWVPSSTTPTPEFSVMNFDPVSLYAEMWKTKTISEAADEEPGSFFAPTIPDWVLPSTNKHEFSEVISTTVDPAVQYVQMWKNHLSSHGEVDEMGPSFTSTILDWVLPTTQPKPAYSPVSWDPVEMYVQLWKDTLVSDAAVMVDDERREVVPELRSVVNYD